MIGKSATKQSIMTSVEMKSSAYQAVGTETKEMISNEQEVVVTKRKYLLVGAFGFFMLGAIFMVMIGAGSSADQLRSSHVSSKAFLDGKCAPCSFAQCKVQLHFFFLIICVCCVVLIGEI